MITTYHRPQTLDEALTLLTQPNTVPLGGGTLLSRPTTDSVQAVDLQSLGLDSLTIKAQRRLSKSERPPRFKHYMKMKIVQKH
jgi:CO/xanthine dehydrogenase FAD-binding subunit